MSGKAFLDTNVFIYSFDKIDKDKASVAVELIRDAARRETGVISFQVIQEFFNVALKRAQPAFSPHEAIRYLMTVLRPLLSVESSLALYSTGLEIQSRWQLSWYDSLIVAAASQAGCSVIYTEDLQHGAKINGIRIENPFRARRAH